MSSNVYPNPGPIYSCSVCAGNVTWRGKPVQCCTCSKWVHLRCSLLSLSKFRTLDSSHSWTCPILLFTPLFSPLPILYLLPLLPHLHLLLLAVFLRPLLPTPSGFFSGMLAFFEPVALNCFTFFRPIPLTLSVSGNPILTHLPLFAFLDSLLCVLIAPTPGLAFSLVMLAMVSSFFIRHGLSFFELFPRPFFLCLTPTLIM